jgi:hypothetical protein
MAGAKNGLGVPRVLDVDVEPTGPVLVTVEYRMDRDFVSDF